MSGKFLDLVMIFRQGCQNCTPRGQTIILGLSKHERLSVENVNAIGKHRLEKRKFERKIFLPYSEKFAEINKKAGYRHIFRPPLLLKVPFKRMKAFFSKNSLQIYSNFFDFKNFLIFCEK